MLQAVAENNADLLKLLMTGHKPRPKEELCKCLIYVLKRKNSECLKHLLERADVDLNFNDTGRKTPIMLCAETGYVEGLNQITVDPRCHVNAQSNSGETALHYAVKCGSEECVRELIRAGADTSLTDAEGNTPLVAASKIHHPNIGVLKLLSNKKNLDKQNKVGRTALHYACSQAMGTKILLSAGACPDIQDHNGNSPLHIAAIEGFDTIIKCLVTYHCNVNLANNYGKMPIHYIAMKGHWQVLEPIISSGGLMNVADNEGKTPLMHAIENKRIDTVITLLKANCCPNTASPESGATPVEVALKKKLTNLVRLLLFFGSRSVWLLNHIKKEGTLNSKFEILLKAGPRAVEETDGNMIWAMSWISSCCDLQHACRIKIREYIRLNENYGQSLIQLPMQVQDFVNFEDLCVDYIV